MSDPVNANLAFAAAIAAGLLVEREPEPETLCDENTSTDVRLLKLSERRLNVLLNAEIKTVEELLSLDEFELLTFDGIGWTFVEGLRSDLAERGFILKSVHPRYVKAMRAWRGRATSSCPACRERAKT